MAFFVSMPSRPFGPVLLLMLSSSCFINSGWPMASAKSLKLSRVLSTDCSRTMMVGGVFAWSWAWTAKGKASKATRPGSQRLNMGGTPWTKEARTDRLPAPALAGCTSPGIIGLQHGEKLVALDGANLGVGSRAE